MKVKFVSKPIPYESELICHLYVKGGDGVYRLIYDDQHPTFFESYIQRRVIWKFKNEICEYAFKKQERKNEINLKEIDLKSAKEKGDEYEIKYANEELNKENEYWDRFFKERDPNKYLPDIFHYDVETRVLTIEYNGSEDFFINGYKFDESFTKTKEFYIELNKFKFGISSDPTTEFKWDTRIFIDDSGKDYTKTNLYKEETEETGGCFGIIMLIPTLSMLYYLFLS